MPEITYVVPDGSVHVVSVPNGQTVMDGSVRNNLPGIVAECGGSCSCATCHVYVDEACAGFFDVATGEELELLEFAEEARPNSRLSCQLIITEACASTRVTVPGSLG